VRFHADFLIPIRYARAMAPPDEEVPMLFQSIDAGATFALDQRAAETNELTLVVGGGRGCVLRTDAPLAGVWIPLRGRMQVGASGAEAELSAGELRISECEQRVQAVGRANAMWIALLGSRQAWRRALRERLEMPTPEPLLLPASHAADSALRRRAIALARAAQHGDGDTAAIPLIETVLAMQAQLGAAIERCPGRTYANRRQVFLRLQRVRNYLAANCHLDLDNDALARMASYSPWHFIRAFRAAYQETPHAFLVDQRLLRARRLLRTSPLAISEIAMASGFENRCAFSRLFRERFGITAHMLRRQIFPTAADPRRHDDTRTHRAISATRAVIHRQLAEVGFS
jgi:AraC family transcriptional regulator